MVELHQDVCRIKVQAAILDPVHDAAEVMYKGIPVVRRGDDGGQPGERGVHARPAYLFAWPFVAWHGLAALRTRRFSAVKALVAATLVALVLNANFYRRNWALFGSPLGPRSSDLDGAEHYVNERLSAGIFVVNILRNAALEAVS